MLQLANVTKFYGSRPALESVSFRVGEGEQLGLLGKNGSGKSTVIRLMTGYSAPTSGYVKVMGINPLKPAARERFGYIPESNPLPAAMRVREYLRFRAGIKGLGRNGAAAVDSAVERCGIRFDLEAIIAQLPRDIRLRVGLADAVLGDPAILLLDDPTAGLDPGQVLEIRSLIQELGLGKTLVLSSHKLDDMRSLCGRIIIFDRGKIAADGTLDSIRDRFVEERIIRLELLTSEPVRETLRTIPGVRAVSIEDSLDDPRAVVVRLTIPSGVDLRREISRICASRGWLATELRIEPLKLEDIFRRLARG